MKQLTTEHVAQQSKTRWQQSHTYLLTYLLHGAESFLRS